MNKNTLRRLRRKLDKLRSGVANLSSADLIGLADSLGRKCRKGGSERNFVSIYFPSKPPFGIPCHGKKINKYTAGGILDDLEGDLFDLEERFEGLEGK